MPAAIAKWFVVVTCKVNVRQKIRVIIMLVIHVRDETTTMYQHQRAGTRDGNSPSILSEAW